MLPLVDVRALVEGEDITDVARQIDDACRRFGFIRIVGHGIPSSRLDGLFDVANRFFGRSDEDKAEIAMSRAGRAWRGWFPLEGELTSGVPDGKEGIYFGEELAVDDPAVVAGRPLHGPNLFPTEPAGMRPAVLGWMDTMTELAQGLLEAMAVGLGLERDWFRSHLTEHPTTLFRIFHYPPGFDAGDAWGVREHTDYGLVTILAQDGTPGLEVYGPDGWIAVPPDPEVLVVNLGDMVETMTGGAYRSTPHRVRNTSRTSRLSLPFFLDPSWDAVPVTIPVDTTPSTEARDRWDDEDPTTWRGPYGEYLTAKVTKVFPHLMRG